MAIFNENLPTSGASSNVTVTDANDVRNSSVLSSVSSIFQKHMQILKKKYLNVPRNSPKLKCS